VLASSARSSAPGSKKFWRRCRPDESEAVLEYAKKPGLPCTAATPRDDLELATVPGVGPSLRHPRSWVRSWFGESLLLRSLPTGAPPARITNRGSGSESSAVLRAGRKAQEAQGGQGPSSQSRGDGTLSPVPHPARAPGQEQPARRTFTPHESPQARRLSGIIAKVLAQFPGEK
jgi:hypothetical protein